MSTLKVTNIQKTGESVSRDVSGVAAAWAVIESTAAISSSLNISSTTSVSTGKIDISLTNSFSDEFWAGVSSPQSSQLFTSTLTNPASGSMRVNSNNSSGLVDARVRLIITGDLA